MTSTSRASGSSVVVSKITLILRNPYRTCGAVAIIATADGR
jgi:hypothetical protein